MHQGPILRSIASTLECPRKPEWQAALQALRDQKPLAQEHKRLSRSSYKKCPALNHAICGVHLWLISTQRRSSIDGPRLVHAAWSQAFGSRNTWKPGWYVLYLGSSVEPSAEVQGQPQSCQEPETRRVRRRFTLKVRVKRPPAKIRGCAACP